MADTARVVTASRPPSWQERGGGSDDAFAGPHLADANSDRVIVANAMSCDDRCHRGHRQALSGDLVVEQLLARVPAAEIGVSVRDPVRGGPPRESAACGCGEGASTNAASTRRGRSRGRRRSSWCRRGRTGRGGAESAPDGDRRPRVAAGTGAVLYTSHHGRRPRPRRSPRCPTTRPPERSCATPAWPSPRAARRLLRRHGRPPARPLRRPGDRGAGRARGQPVAWTTHTDLAEATAIALTDKAGLDGVTPRPDGRRGGRHGGRRGAGLRIG